MRRKASLFASMALVAAACSTGVPADVADTSSATSTEAPSLTAMAPIATTAAPGASTTVTTSTAAPDLEPPELTIVDPEEGVPVTTRKYEFQGTTEPGATVIAAGRYDVAVADDGSWSMLLVLERGGNLALFSATDEAGNTTEIRMTVVYEPPFTSPDYWTGRTVTWERSGIGRWASVEDEGTWWEQDGTSLGGSVTGHLLSLTAPTERDPAQPKESLLLVLSGDVVVAGLHLAIPAGFEAGFDCSPVDGASGDRADLVGVVAVGAGPVEPAQLWQLGGGITTINPSGYVCES
jgi:hypothetical protein